MSRPWTGPNPSCDSSSLSIPALAVVVPVHDEQDNVEPLLDEIEAALEGRVDFEVVFVDDASADETLRRLRQARLTHPRLRVLHHLRNCGQSAAVATGVRRARAPVVVTLDGDGQNDPADIPALLQRWHAESVSPPSGQPLLLAGWRQRRRDQGLRRLSSRVANAFRARMLGDGTPDTGCGLKMFERDLFLRLPHFDHMHRFLPALVLREGGRVISVPVHHRPRLRGQSHYGVWNRLWVGLVDVLGVMWLRRRIRLSPVEETPASAAER
jgi:dolichol-phosphate mannosyltransferase